ncbi:MAG: protein kinase [Deltaproteobacteria bacterium]|nr:protein kinase [Deltaproteobacteria bacterium]
MPLPELFGPYLLHQYVAQGTTSEVFLAQTLGEYPRLCTVKRILPELSAFPEFQARFRKDAGLLVRLIHGNLVQVLEVGAVDAQPFVAMELLDGVDLAALVAQVPEQGPLPPEVALFVALELCEAVAYIRARRQEAEGTTSFPHDAPWPLEVLITLDGVVKIMDLGSFGALGIGRQKVAQLFRSPGYASPEVILKQPLDLRADLFAVGLVTWELLVGQRLVADAPEQFVRDVLAGSWKAPLVERKDVAGEVIRLVARLLELDPAKRPAELEEVRAPLVSALRRLSPAYGSAALSRLVLRRFPDRAALAESRAAKLVPYEPEPTRAAATAKTQTFGRAAAVTRTLAEPQALKVGERIPGTRYRLVRSLGRGGSAEVFAAQHMDLDRQVAIKVLSARLAQSAEAITHFRMEARACSRLRHAHIVDVMDFGELPDGRFFFAMELVEGESLADLLDRERRLTPGRAIGIFRQLARALQAAHAHGIIHRDLKPENIMLVEREGRGDFVKVLDFGVMAFATDTARERVGTPGYMSPEQGEGEPPSPAMDIYALGVTLYEALSGELPYPAQTFEEFRRKQAAGSAPALRSHAAAADVPVALERVVHRALEADPRARHPSMAELETELFAAGAAAGADDPWADEATELAPDFGAPATSGAGPRWVEPPPARRTSVAIAVAGLAAAVGMGAVAWMLLRPPIPTPLPPTPRWAGAPSTSRDAAPRGETVPGGGAAPKGETVPKGAAAPDASAPERPARPTSPPRPVPARRAERRGAGASPSRQERRTEESPRDAARAGRLVSEGKALLLQGKLPEAQQRFGEAVRADPADAAAVTGLASVAFERAQYLRTVELARQAVSLSRRQLQARILLGDAYFKLLRHDEALKAWQEVLRIDPGHPTALKRVQKVKRELGGASAPGG